uniref:Uncharacterized protein n=1 Tax=Tetradesmus obliquus TaxID=3088 RepID=A0A383WNJ9_TETOB|eukprot:jgi/Sobl393_1/13862/SZX78981.1
MTVESVAEFSLWPSFAAVDSFEADTGAAAAAAVGLLGGSFAPMRTNDVSPFSSMSDQAPQFGLDAAGSMGNDQLFHSAEAANTAELFALLQQQQQQQPQSSSDEQCIDAEISRLLQMKQALHRQRQQPPGQGQATAAPILEDEPFVVQQSHLSQTMQSTPSGSSCGGIIPAVSLSLDQSLPMDCLLTPAQSATLDISQDWAWAAGAARAAQQQPMRHSIDLGGLAQRMAAFDIGSSNSFTTGHQSCNFTGAQQLPMGSHFAAQQSMAAAAAAAAASAAAAAAALSAATGPFCGGGLAGSSGLPPAGAGLAGNQLAGNQLTLQSALYMPAANSSRLSMEQPALPHMQQPAAYGLRAAPVNRIPTGRMSLDVTACSSLYSSSAAPMGVNAGMQQQIGLTGAQAAWLSSAAVGAANRVVSSINTNQRASMDIPLSRTPDGRCPPRKSASIVSTGTARDSPTQAAAGRKSATFGAEDRPGGASGAGRNNGGKSGPVHQAPKWAGSHWHPMADVVKSGQIANKGTGVFIPGGVKATAS